MSLRNSNKYAILIGNATIQPEQMKLSPKFLNIEKQQRPNFDFYIFNQ